MPQNEYDDKFTHTCGCEECGTGTIDFISEITYEVTRTDEAEELGRRFYKELAPHLHEAFLKGFT